MDLHGNILHSQLMEKIFSIKNISYLNRGLNSFEETIHKVKNEISHVNSIYEIPKLKSKRNPDYIKEGNIIINSTVDGIFILSPDLTEVLHHKIFNNSINHWIHDVQVTDEGRFLYFNNVVSTPKANLTMDFLGGGKEFTSYHSSIEEIVPDSQKILHKFEANPKSVFFSWVCGSIQELDNDTWLFSHHLMGSYIYSKRKKNILATIPLTHMAYSGFLGGQQSKAFDLSKFLTFH